MAIPTVVQERTWRGGAVFRLPRFVLPALVPAAAHAQHTRKELLSGLLQRHLRLLLPRHLCIVLQHLEDLQRQECLTMCRR